MPAKLYNCAMAGQIKLFAILKRTPKMTKIRYKAETWRKNEPNGVVTEVANWCQSRHIASKSATLTGG